MFVLYNFIIYIILFYLLIKLVLPERNLDLKSLESVNCTVPPPVFRPEWMTCLLSEVCLSSCDKSHHM